MKAYFFKLRLAPQTLKLWLFTTLSSNAFAYQPMAELAQDHQFDVARQHLLSHQEALTRLVNYALTEDEIDKVFLSAQGELDVFLANNTPHSKKVGKAQKKTLEKLLTDANVQAFEKKAQQVFIPQATTHANGNTLFSSMLYSPEKIDLTEDCKSFNRRKSFTICIWPIKGNWYMYYDWSYFPKKKSLQVKH